MKDRHKKIVFQRMLRMILPVVIFTIMILCSAQVQKVKISSDTAAVYVKATVTEVLEDYSSGEPFTGSQKVAAVITGGEYKGRYCELVNANTYQRGALCLPGTKIIALLQSDADGILQGTVYNYDRTAMVYLLLGLFAMILVLVGGKKGAASLYALIFTVICVFCIYIPMLYAGINGMSAAVLTAVVILAASIYILNGWSAKSLCAVIGTTIGVAVSGLLAMGIGIISKLSGFNMEDVESMVYIANSTNLDVANILYAGVLISSLGAVMDVSVTVVAAMQEIYEKAPGLQAKELFLSGMHVGHDMMGTMSNTLILAYTGSATGVLLTVYSFEMPYLQIMGYNSIIIEIVSGICGTIGVVLTVPAQAIITTLVLKAKCFQRS